MKDAGKSFKNDAPNAGAGAGAGAGADGVRTTATGVGTASCRPSAAPCPSDPDWSPSVVLLKSNTAPAP